jgi:DNA recombination protein Rad52
MFNDEQKQLLAAPLQKAHVKSRSGGGGRSLSYIEGWHAIAEANRIFGFDGWASETVSMECVGNDGGTVSYVAKVRVTVDGITREGWGAGHGRGGSAGDRHESAVKEAETDARKRALMTFGNQFGLALYDKDQTNVEGTSLPAQQAPSAKRKGTNPVMVKATAYAQEVEIDKITEAEAFIRGHKGLNTIERAELVKILNKRREAAV